MGKIADRSFRVALAVLLVAWIVWMVGVQADYEYLRTEDPVVTPAPVNEAPANDVAATEKTNPWAIDRASAAD